MTILRLVGAVLLALLPSALKVPLYRRLFGYRIGRRVRIGLSPLIGVGSCVIGDDVRIGHLNAFVGVAHLELGAHAGIGVLNLFRGGSRITLGEYVTVLRGNVINSIPEPDAVNPTDPVLEVGRGAVITNGHWLDFTDRVALGSSVIVGGRGSSFWTHNRQRTKPIAIGRNVYIGSDARFAPGATVAEDCIIGLGSVVIGRFEEPRVLILGNPAEVRRPLTREDLFLVRRKTRPDLPEAPADARAPASSGLPDFGSDG